MAEFARIAPTARISVAFNRVVCSPYASTTLAYFYFDGASRLVGVLQAGKYLPPTSVDSANYARWDAESARWQIARQRQDEMDQAEAAAVLARHAARARDQGHGPCGGPDIRLDASGGSMAHVPVLDQGNVGTCYAYAGAAAYDAYRFSHGDTRYDQLSSPIEAAVNGSLNALAARPATAAPVITAKPEEFFFEGGPECEVFNYLVQYGGCARSQLADRTAKLPPKEFLRSLRVFHDRAVADRSGGSISSLADDLRAYLLTSGFARATVISRDDLMTALREPGTERFFHAIFAGSCPDDLRLRPASGEAPSCRSTFFLEPTETPVQRQTAYSKLARAIDTQLAQVNPQPIPIAYCEGLLEKTGGRGYDFHQDRGCGPHASVIIGRRYDAANDQCQVLIQNSFGTSRTNGSPDWSNEGGKLWVDLGTLSANMISYGVIESGSSGPAAPRP